MNYNLDSMFGVKDKVVIITGGSGGIGGGLTDILLSLGANVAIVDINAQSIEKKLEESKSLAGSVKGYQADITDEEAIEKIFKQVYEDFGSIYAILNCAGISHVEFLSEMPMDKWQKVMDVNLRGTVICTKIAGNYMKQAGIGRVINISSLAATHGKPKYTAYTPSKAAVNAFTFTLAAEWARQNITVNSISPVLVVTDINRKQIEADPKFFESIINTIPQGRLCSADFLGGLVVFLLSESSSYITGQCIGCDGGAENGDVANIAPEPAAS